MKYLFSNRRVKAGKLQLKHGAPVQKAYEQMLSGCKITIDRLKLNNHHSETNYPFKSHH